MSFNGNGGGGTFLNTLPDTKTFRVLSSKCSVKRYWIMKMNCMHFTILWKLRDPQLLSIQKWDRSFLFWNYSLNFCPQLDVKMEDSARCQDAIGVTFKKEATIPVFWMKKQFPDSKMLTPEGGEVGCVFGCAAREQGLGCVALRIECIPHFLRAVAEIPRWESPKHPQQYSPKGKVPCDQALSPKLGKFSGSLFPVLPHSSSKVGP